MSVLNPNSDDEPQECPLCMEYLELDDIYFYPCSCGYQICRFCWSKIRTEGSGLCPACRSPYSENPADFKPLTAEELAKIKEEKRKKDQAKKQKISENRKHLANVRVVQRNLVFVVGLSPRLADRDVLCKAEYFGKFGRIHKVVINTSTSYAGNQSQGPSASAYVTYYKSEDALRAIQAVNNIFIDGRTLKASLGTTKYCSHFMKNQTCPKHDCMYLHELGDDAASFTKEEMQQGKHTEYEKSLHEELMASAAAELSDGGSVVSNGTPALGGGPSGVKAGVGDNNSSSKSSRTPSPKVGNTGWPILTSSSAGAVAANAALSGSLGSNGSCKGMGNSFRNDNPDSRSNSPNLRDGGLQHHLNHQQATPDSPASSRSAARTPHELLDEHQHHHHHHHLHNNHQHHIETDLASHLNDVKNCDFNREEWTSITNGDLFGEDDLGFDPFHETQKALAEMIESESKQHLEALQLLEGGSSSLTNGGGVGLMSGSGNSTINSGRPKQPPPGFSLLNLTGVQPPAPSLLSQELQNLGGSILDNFASGQHHLPHMNQGFGSHNDFAATANGYRHSSQQHQQQQQQFAWPSDNHLGQMRGVHSQQQQQQQHSQHQMMEKTTKDWQEGLRALLPNVNVSFGALPNQPDMMPTTPNGRMFSSPTLSDHHNHHDRRHQHSGWNNMNPNDWTVLDPAIVGGQLADPNSGSNRSDSPSNWIKANLEQLTAETFNPVTSLLPGFSGLNLASAGNPHQQHTSAGLNNWGGQSGLLANTPPPGFSFNRVGPASVGGNNPLQHPYPNMPGMNSSNDAQLENDFRGLIRS